MQLNTNMEKFCLLMKIDNSVFVLFFNGILPYLLHDLSMRIIIFCTYVLYEFIHWGLDGWIVAIAVMSRE